MLLKGGRHRRHCSLESAQVLQMLGLAFQGRSFTGSEEARQWLIPSMSPLLSAPRKRIKTMMFTRNRTSSL